jgi:hypothetical protein
MAPASGSSSRGANGLKVPGGHARQGRNRCRSASLRPAKDRTAEADRLAERLRRAMHSAEIDPPAEAVGAPAGPVPGEDSARVASGLAERTGRAADAAQLAWRLGVVCTPRPAVPGEDRAEGANRLAEVRGGAADVVEPVGRSGGFSAPARACGVQKSGSSCGEAVFVDQSAESVSAPDVVWSRRAGRSERCRIGRQ